MKRLTSDKNTSDMSMLELAYNSSYIDNGNDARFRNYELDIDSRQLVKELAKDICNEDFSNLSDEEFDEYMASMLSVEIDSTIGLLAVFYRNLWAMADLREKLKEYEDSEEQGRLIKLPCKEGDIVYVPTRDFISEFRIIQIIISGNDRLFRWVLNTGIYPNLVGFSNEDIGKNVFLTKFEAEAKLRELRGNNGK